MGEKYMTKKTKVVGSLSAVVAVLVVTLVIFVFGSDSTSAPDETTTSTTPIETKLLYGSVPATWPIRLGSIRIYEDGTAKYDSLAERFGLESQTVVRQAPKKDGKCGKQFSWNSSQPENYFEHEIEWNPNDCTQTFEFGYLSDDDVVRLTDEQLEELGVKRPSLTGNILSGVGH